MCNRAGVSLTQVDQGRIGASPTFGARSVLGGKHVRPVIEQAEHYPEFLPWCVGATILERSDDWVAGRSTSRSCRSASRSGRAIRSAVRNGARRLVDGPFRHFDGDWRLTPLGDVGCKIEFDVSYEIADGLLDQLARPAVDFVSRSMMDAFVRRAEHISSEVP